ncbi:MAG: VCBS repeat-containing protein [Granulosicoccus sp.]|nr:VCBS repeat-containing protein [Granulosicoccus sp.]
MGRGSIPLDGSQSSDANGDEVNFDWLIASAPPGSRAALINADTALSQLNPDQFGRYIVTLVVNDGEDESNTAYAVIDVESAQFATAEITATSERVDALTGAGFRNAIPIDANEDGLNDLVMGSCDEKFSVLLRENNGWTHSQVVTTNSGFCHDVATVGDYNNDGHQDIAIGREIFTGDGLGQFTFWLTLAENDIVSGLATGDFNGDGIDDVAVAFNAAETIRITFGGVSLPLRTSATLDNPLGLGVIALDESNSELSDFAFYSSRFDEEGRSELSIVQGSPDESYTPIVTDLPGFGSIGSGDLNGDGYADIVLSIYGGTILINSENTPRRIDTDVRVATMLSNGDGSFKPANFVGAVDHATGGIKFIDINRDGFQDVLLLGAAPVRMSVLLGDGRGNYSSLTVLPNLPSGIPTAGDADGDGLIDVIIPTGTNTGFWVAWGRDLPF